MEFSSSSSKLRAKDLFICIRFLLYILLLAPVATIAEDYHYTLSGRIMDTSDNWLPDARVALKNANVVTKTDGNGLFELKVTLKTPYEVKSGAVYNGVHQEFLEVDKEGHIGTSIEINDLDFFNNPTEVKLEPNPIGVDNVGFSVRMSRSNSLQSLSRQLKIKTGEYVEPEVYINHFKNRNIWDDSKNSERVSFYCYVPEEVKKVKASFLISRHGMGTIDLPLLREFAAENDIALIGILGTPVQVGFYPVSLIDKHIKKLAELVKHPEIAEAPFFTFGHSNGTGFATILASQRPEKAIGWVSFHSGWSWHLQYPGVEKVPGLVMHGKKDNWEKHGQAKTVQNLRSKRSAAISMMMEANVGHGPANPDETWKFIIEFCKATMRIRLNPDGSLKPVVIEDGWLGEIYDDKIEGQQKLAIYPYEKYPGDKTTANWLPDEAFAKIWQEYSMTHPTTREKTE